MKRRSFIQSLLAVPVVAAVAKVALPQPSLPSPPREVQTAYKGFVLRWSGWIGNVNRPMYAGHWVGINSKTGVSVYASYPGKEGRFVKGDSFDITRVYPQIEISLETTEEEKEQARMECLQRIIRVIDDWRPGLTTRNNGRKESYLQRRALAGIRKGQLLRNHQFKQGVVPMDESGGGWFAGVAMHDAMKGDFVKVMTEGSTSVRFK